MEAYPSKGVDSVFALVVVLISAGEGIRSNVAIFFGGLSFPLYLNHWIGHFVVHAYEKIVIDLSEPVVIGAAYFVSVVIAGVMYWGIDRQIQLRRGRWYSDLLGRRLMIAGYALFAIGVVAGGAMHLYGPHGSPPVSSTANAA